MRARLNQVSGGGESVDETGAGRDQIESPGVLCAELMLHQAGRGGKHHVGRNGADQDRVELTAIDATLCQRRASRFDRHVRGGDVRGGDVALGNPDALQDPFVAGLDHLFEIVVGEHAGRHVAAQGADLYSRHYSRRHSWQVCLLEGNAPCYLSKEMFVESPALDMAWEPTKPATPEQIYARVFRRMKPRTPLPQIEVQVRRYANANAQIRLEEGTLRVRMADTLAGAPESVHEALAEILLSKLFRRPIPAASNDRYRRYLNRRDVRRSLDLVKHIRGRKHVEPPQGKHFDLVEIFEELNLKYFFGLMARPSLGWSKQASRTMLGHYDPPHNAIVISRILDRPGYASAGGGVRDVSRDAASASSGGARRRAAMRPHAGV